MTYKIVDTEVLIGTDIDGYTHHGFVEGIQRRDVDNIRYHEHKKWNAETEQFELVTDVEADVVIGTDTFQTVNGVFEEDRTELLKTFVLDNLKKVYLKLISDAEMLGETVEAEAFRAEYITKKALI